MYQFDADRLVCSLQPDAVAAVIPGTNTTIGDDTFSGCVSLQEITFPGSHRRLGDGCFCGRTQLTGISLPDNVAAIHAQAFQGCTQLHKYTLEFIADHIVDPTVTDICSRASASAIWLNA